MSWSRGIPSLSYCACLKTTRAGIVVTTVTVARHQPPLAGHGPCFAAHPAGLFLHVPLYYFKSQHAAFSRQILATLHVVCRSSRQALDHCIRGMDGS